MFSIVNQVFAVEFMWSVVNEVFAAELCCPQRMRCSLPNCVVRSNQVFAAEFLLSTVNQVIAVEFAFRSELTFATEVELTKVVFSVVNQRSLLKLCFLQWKCDSLPKSS